MSSTNFLVTTFSLYGKTTKIYNKIFDTNQLECNQIVLYKEFDDCTFTLHLCHSVSLL